MLRFDWDPEKATSNESKHGVAFPEAATAFGDPLSLTIPDPVHSAGEARFVHIALTYLGRLVVVTNLESDSSILIIIARSATRPKARVLFCSLPG